MKIASTPYSYRCFGVAGSPEPAIAAIRVAVRSLDPSLSVFDVQTLNTVID